jgi:hypothetical protein
MNTTEPIYDLEAEDLKELLEELHISPTEEIVDRLKNGEETGLLENVFINGEYKDGKLKVFKDGKGVVKFKFNKKEDKLIIPDKILDHALTDEEKKTLESGDIVFIKKGERQIAVGVDPELNKVTIKGEKKLTTLNEIGGYTLSEQEKNSIAAGKSVGPKVLYDKKTKQYIQATIAFTEDGKGIKLTNLKPIQPEKAQELIEKYNAHENQVTSAVNIGSEIISQTQEKAASLEAVQALVSQKEYDKLSELMQTTPLSKEEKEVIRLSDPYANLSAAEKISIDKILATSSPEEASKTMTKGELDTAGAAIGEVASLEKPQVENNQVSSAIQVGSEVIDANEASLKVEPKNENEILKMVAEKDYKNLISTPSSVQVLDNVLKSNEYNSLDMKHQKAVEVALNQANQGNIKAIVLKEKINQAIQFNSPEKLTEVLKDEKVTKELLNTIKSITKENGKEDTFKEIVKKVEKDLSPQNKKVAISKTKSITK